jgi:hypothetical protein
MLTLVLLKHTLFTLDLPTPEPRLSKSHFFSLDNQQSLLNHLQSLAKIITNNQALNKNNQISNT